jgi:hypothetical protein
VLVGLFPSTSSYSFSPYLPPSRLLTFLLPFFYPRPLRPTHAFLPINPKNACHSPTVSSPLHLNPLCCGRTPSARASLALRSDHLQRELTKVAFTPLALVHRDDQLRSTHLLPPPLLSPKQAEHQQHLKPAKPSGGAGLDQARFQALLQASRSPDRCQQGPRSQEGSCVESP